MTSMRRILFPALFAGILFVPPATYALEISEENVAGIALQNNPAVLNARQELDAARGRALQGRAALLPKIVVSLAYNRYTKPVYGFLNPSDLTSTDTLSPTFVSDLVYTGELFVRQPLFAWGKHWNADRRGQAGLSTAQMQYRTVIADTVYQAKVYYYQALLARHTLDISRESMNITARRCQMMTDLKLRGRASQYDVDKASVSFIAEQVNVSRAENSLRLAVARLKTFLATDEYIAVTGEFRYEPKEYRLGDIIAVSSRNRPDILQARYRSEEAERTLNILKADRLPSFDAEFLSVHQSPGAAYNWYRQNQARIVMNWDIFSGFAGYGAIKQARADLQKSRIAGRAITDTTVLEATEAYYLFAQAQESIGMQEGTIALARHNIAIAEEKFRLGMITPLELQDVQLNLAQAERNYQQALFDYNMAVASIERITGGTGASEESAPAE